MEPMFIKHRLKRLARRLHLLQLAAWGYELYRLIRRPHTHGSLVAIWKSNQLLLVQTSYRKGYGLPGGGIQAGESARDAAIRELQEELGLAIESSWLQDPWSISERQPGGLNTVTIFRLPWDQHLTDSIHAPNRPPVEIDQLEIIATAWMSREEALNQHLPNHLRHYLKTYGFRSKTHEL
jgi:8-oxo-dGTP pyrophosphatase MutT (NUDIX family)